MRLSTFNFQLSGFTPESSLIVRSRDRALFETLLWLALLLALRL